jgi:hypothetical protein
MPAISSLEQEAKQRYQFMPFKNVPTAKAVGTFSDNVCFFRDSENTYVHETADDDSEYEDKGGE